jgi:transposase
VDLCDVYDQLIREIEAFLVRNAKIDDPHAYHLLKTVPGIGQVLGLVLLYEIHDISRFPSVQDFVSYCRLVKCAKESAGKKYGTGGGKIGNAHLKWAFSEAALLFLREVPKAKQLVERLTAKHGKGKALAILSRKLGTTVYYMLKRNEAFNVNKFFLD